MVLSAQRPGTSPSPEVGQRLVDAYVARTPRSSGLAQRARAVLPGGDTRTVAYHPPYPLTVASGGGCRMTDVDGNTYIDLISNYTSLIHGHAHPAIVRAVAEQLPKGTNYATSLEAQTRLAEILTGRVATLDKVRFTNSGTEATMNAARAARAFTGRDLLVKMEGGYHGSYDDFEVSVHPEVALAGPADAPVGVMDSRGVPKSTLHDVVVTPFNDVDALRRTMDHHGKLTAAVIVEPVMGSAGVIPAEPGFLEEVQRLCREHGALFVADEVMSFRLDAGGYQAVLGVQPDLTTFAKIVGGGFPVGAFGGRDDVMAMFDPSRPGRVSQSGTFNGNAVTMVAGIAAMELLTTSEIARINTLGDRLRDGLASTLNARGIAAVGTGFGSMVGVHLVDGPVRNYRDAAGSDPVLKRQLHTAMLLEGLFAAPRLMFCTSTPMDEAVVDEVIERFGRAVDRIAA